MVMWYDLCLLYILFFSRNFPAVKYPEPAENTWCKAGKVYCSSSFTHSLHIGAIRIS